MDRSCPHHATRKTGKTVVTTVTGVIGGSIGSFEPFGGSILSGAEKNDLPKKTGKKNRGCQLKLPIFFGGDQIFTHVLGIVRHFPFSCALFGWECNDC